MVSDLCPEKHQDEKLLSWIIRNMLNVDIIEIYIVYLKIIDFYKMKVANAINVNEIPIYRFVLQWMHKC